MRTLIIGLCLFLAIVYISYKVIDNVASEYRYDTEAKRLINLFLAVALVVAVVVAIIFGYQFIFGK